MFGWTSMANWPLGPLTATLVPAMVDVDAGRDWLWVLFLSST